MLASIASAIASAVRIPSRATRIIERHRRQDRQRLSRTSDRLKEINDLKNARADALQRQAYYEDFDRRGKLFKEKIDIEEDGTKNVARVPDPALQEIAAEIKALDKKSAVLQAEADAPCITAGRLETQLAAISPDATVTEFLVTPELGNGESFADALARKRREIIARREERADVAGKHRTKKEMLEAAREQIHAFAGRGQPKVRPLLEGGTIEFPMTKLPQTAGNFFNYVPDGAALVCYLMESEILRKVEELIDFNADAANAMPQAEQAAALAKLDADIMRLRREEAALVESVVADGGNAWHFPDAPLEAVLGISIT